MDNTGYAFAVSFFIASLLGTASPGPATVYVAKQGLSGGMQMALASLLGILTGDVIYIALVASGLSAALLASCTVLNLITYTGAAYLIYIGSCMINASIHAPSSVGNSSTPAAEKTPRQAYLGALALHATNPKALIYFGSVFVQFIDPGSGSPVWQQLALLATIHMPTAAAVLFAYSTLAAKFRRNGIPGVAARVLDGTTGTFLIISAVAITIWRQQSAGFCM